MNTNNLFDSIPADLASESFVDLVRAPGVRVERIVSRGHSSPADGWYDQDEDEWVLVLQGRALLDFAEGSSSTLSAGEYLNIPAHTKHRVSWTAPDELTIWLAVFYRQS